MNQKWAALLFLFTILCLGNLYAEWANNSTLIFLTKPLLLTVLSIYFYLCSPHLPSRFRYYLLTGLIFSIGGDTLLMFVENSPGKEHFFLLGLGSFLITHVCYLLAFFYFPSPKKGYVKKHPWIAILFLLYLIGNSIFLWPDLGADLKIPVLLYSTAIILMTLFAVNLKGKINAQAFTWLITGILLFVLSDSLIALNKFKSDQLSIPFVRLLIMLFYLSGQFLIVKGALNVSSNE